MAKDTLLQQLRDIHYPEPIGFWPMAKAWWLLMALLLMLSCGIFYMLKWWKSYSIKRQFLDELNLIESTYHQNRAAKEALSQLAILLKRVALTYYPRADVASLYGPSWVLFLQSTGPKVSSHEWADLLTDALYQADIGVEITSGFQFARQWIKKQGVPCTN